LSSPTLTRIGPERARIPRELTSLWEKRELIALLLRRDLRTRYAQTWGGWAWAVFKPLLQLAVYTFVFGFVLRQRVEGQPFVLFLFAGLIPWFVFLEIAQHAGRALETEGDLIKKINVPRLMLPIWKSVLPLIDLAIYLLLFVGLSLLYGQWPTWKLLLLPLCAAGTWGLGLAAALWLNYWFATRRDAYHLAQNLLGFGLWAAPIFYGFHQIPFPFDAAMAVNPLGALVQAYRFALCGEAFPPACWWGAAMAVAVGAGGLWVYVKNQHLFAENC
jgi:lipopolysaccharide transport system permease protein